MVTFIGMCVVATLIGVGVYALLTRDGNETVIDENE